MRDELKSVSKDQENKASVKSGHVNKDLVDDVMGGYPEKRDIAWINKQNSPQGRKRAPGSVRV